MRSGFTWLELLLATSVAAVFLALAQGPLLHFSSLLTDQYTTSGKQRQLDRFLLMLKTELIQAGYALGDDAEPVQVSSDEILLLADLNRDGDLNDTRERISYRFRSADKKLQRRSGSGSYQTLVEEVGAISFALGPGRDLPMSPPQHCVVVGVRLDPDVEDLSYTLCPIFL
jgi:type II secretory pathway component PulJ